MKEAYFSDRQKLRKLAANRPPPQERLKPILQAKGYMTLERNSDLHKEMKCARKGIKRASKEIKQPNLLLTDTKCGKLHEPDMLPESWLP